MGSIPLTDLKRQIIGYLAAAHARGIFEIGEVEFARDLGLESSELRAVLSQLRASDVLDDVGDLSSLALSPFGVRLSKEIARLDANLEFGAFSEAETEPTSSDVPRDFCPSVTAEGWRKVVSQVELPASEREMLSALGAALFSHPAFPELFARLNRK